jgi:hypothetical protein
MLRIPNATAIDPTGLTAIADLAETSRAPWFGPM